MTFQEGASLTQQAKGYSIGLFNSFSYVNSGSDSAGAGNVAVGGLGFGKGESSYSSKPWLRVQFFRERSVPAAATLPEPLNHQNSQNGKGSDTIETKTSGPTPEEIYIVEPLANPSKKD